MLSNLRDGQVSIYLKPFIVIIFALLLIFIIQSIFNFQGSLAEDKQRSDFLSSFDTIFRKLTTCLEPETPQTLSRTVLNSTQLTNFASTYQQTEPDCAESFSYGYNITVRHDCLSGISSPLPTCPTSSWSFGETTASPPNAQDNTLTVSYPALIQHTPTLRVPGTVTIKLRSGDLERFYGFLNKVIRVGKQRADPIKLRLRITNDQQLCIDSSNQVCIGGTSDCIPLKTGGTTSIEKVSLPPGSHIIDATYDQGTDTVAISGGINNAC